MESIVPAGDRCVDCAHVGSLCRTQLAFQASIQDLRSASIEPKWRFCVSVDFFSTPNYGSIFECFGRKDFHDLRLFTRMKHEERKSFNDKQIHG